MIQNINGGNKQILSWQLGALCDCARNEKKNPLKMIEKFSFTLFHCLVQCKGLFLLKIKYKYNRIKKYYKNCKKNLGLERRI